MEFSKPTVNKVLPTILFTLLSLSIFPPEQSCLHQFPGMGDTAGLNCVIFIRYIMPVSSWFEPDNFGTSSQNPWPFYIFAAIIPIAYFLIFYIISCFIVSRFQKMKKPM